MTPTNPDTNIPPDNHPQTKSIILKDPNFIFPIVILKFKVTASIVGSTDQQSSHQLRT